jgi:selenocysteine lyase/cysteine desulfurase
MAALTTAVLGLVSAGDHVIGQKSTYGGTASVLLRLLPRLGVTTTQVDQTDAGAFERALTPQTRLILLESPSNPLLQITDLRSVAAMARARGVLTMADNTFATPINQRPADLGIDLVWHSATKYLNGHTDVSAGVLAGPAQLLDQIWEVAVLTGAVLGPFALEPDLSRIPTAMVGAIGAYPDGSEHAFELRTFAPGVGVAEDPVCGSMNAAVAQWLFRTGAVSGRYRVAQGRRLDRAGDITITAGPDGTIWVGGNTSTLFQGTAFV